MSPVTGGPPGELATAMARGHRQATATGTGPETTRFRKACRNATEHREEGT
jgi:hypothetical protein